MHISKKTLNILRGIFVLLIAGVVFYFIHLQQTTQLAKKNGSEASAPSEVTVSITDSGFSPDTISVAKGGKVTWTNNSSKEHWPASDPHPTHDFYPGFDPLKGIKPGESWSFVFNNPGEWGYHDHLIPHLRGTINVVEGVALKGTDLPPEIKVLLAETDKKKQAKIVHDMAEKYGPRETLDFMNRSGLPYTGETHLLVHEIGNVAYEKYGEDALLYCNETFLSACYHGVVLNELGDHGMEGLAKMMAKCKAADVHVIAQCSHAAGHGFLAWKDYKVLEALPYCDELNKREPAAPAFNCYDGVFMENIFGVHEGKPSENRMVKESDPNYPCDAVPEKYKNGCWADQATLMYQIFKGDLRKVAQACDALTNKTYQATCYNNFARQIHPETNGKADVAVKLCQNATGEWKDQCLITLVDAAFSVGDRQSMPYELCALMENSPKQDECYTALYNNIRGYGSTPQLLAEYCGYIKEENRVSECAKKFNVTVSAPLASASAVAGEFVNTSSGTESGPASSDDINKIKSMGEKQGVATAYNYLKQNWANNPVQGHDLAHVIGQLAYVQEGSKGFAVCDSAFGFGCYHGLMEVFIKKEGMSAIEKGRSACEALGLPGQVASCLHGLGHGIMGSLGEVNKSITQCENFPQNERQYCFDGSFMEYYTGIMKNSEKNLKADFSKPWDFCLTVAKEAQGQCVRNAAFFLLYSGPNTFPQTAEACNKLQSDLKFNCLQSGGLYSAQVANGDIKVAQNLCKNFKNEDDASFCITGAAQEFMFENKGKEKALALCSALNSSWRPKCEDGIKQMVSDYGDK